jgi:tripartite-type tricarboxylate transporter receptor subunit TctC
VDFDFYGHQIVAHLCVSMDASSARSEVDGHGVPVRHFGMVLTMPDWEALASKLKALGISVPKRYASLPEVPTISEAGVPGFEFSVWTGIAMPVGTPKSIRDQVNTAISKALEAPEVRSRFETLGFLPGDGDPQALRKKIHEDFAKWKRVIQAARIPME